MSKKRVLVTTSILVLFLFAILVSALIITQDQQSGQRLSGNVRLNWTTDVGTFNCSIYYNNTNSATGTGALLVNITNTTMTSSVAWNYTLVTTTLGDGNYSFNITCITNDTNLINSTVRTNMILDNNASEIFNTFPAPNVSQVVYTNNPGAQQFRNNVTEAFIDNVVLFYRRFGVATFSTATMTCSGNTIGLGVVHNCSTSVNLIGVAGNGQNVTFYYNATDLQNRSTLNGTPSSPFFLFLDTVNVTVTSDSPADNTFNNSGAVTFRATPVDDNIDECRLYMNATGGSANLLLNYTWIAPTNNTQQNISRTLQLGNYTWTIGCNDTAGAEVNTTLRQVYLDNVTPEMTLQVQGNDSFLSSSTVTLGFYMNDSGVAGFTTSNNCTLYFDNALNQTNGSVQNNTQTNFSAIVVSETNHTWNVTCADASVQNRATDNTRIFTVDLTNPTVTLTNLANNVFDPGDRNVTFNATVVDNNLDECRLYLNGTGGSTLLLNYSWIAPTNNSNQNVTRELAIGNYTWTIGCNDTAGREVNASTRQVYVDDVAPTINIAVPPDNVFFTANTTNLTFTFNVTDIGVGGFQNNNSCNLTIDGALNNTNVTVLNLTNTGLNSTTIWSERNHTWNVTCMDAGGRIASTAVRNFAVDLVNPTVTLSAPAQDLIKSSIGGPMMFNFTGTDDNLDTCTLHFNGTGGTSLTINYTFAALANGTIANLSRVLQIQNYTWLVSCNDSAGRETNSSNRQVYVDRTGAIITLVEPNNNVFLNDSAVRFQFNITESGILGFADNTTCNLSINSLFNQTNVSVLNNSGTNISATTTFSNARTSWNITCMDAAGNITSVFERNFTVDTVSPTLANESPVNNTIYNNLTNAFFRIDLVEQNVNFTGATKQNVTIFYRAAGVPAYTNSTLGCTGTAPNYLRCNRTIDISALVGDADQLQYYYETQDLAAHVSNRGTSGSPLNVSLNVEAPSVTLNLANNTNMSNTTIVFAYTPVVSGGASLANCTLYTNTSGSFVANLTTTTLTSGTQTNFSLPFATADILWNVQCYDNSDNLNWSSVNRSIRVDRVAPVATGLQVQLISDGAVLTNVTLADSLNISISITDPITGVANVNVTGNNTAGGQIIIMTRSANNVYNATANVTTLGCPTNNRCALTVLAYDGVSTTNGGANLNTTTLTLTHDAIAPAINITTHVTGGNVTGILSINGTVADNVNGTGVSGVKIVITNQTAGRAILTATVSGSNWNHTINTQVLAVLAGADQTFNVTVNASDVDNVNNNDTVRINTIQTDNSNPLSTNLSLDESAAGGSDFNVTPTTSIFINISVTDVTGITYVNISNGTVLAMAASPSTGIYNLTTTPNALGCVANDVCMITARVFDASGNSNTTTTLTFRVDNSTPQVSNLTLDEAAAGASDFNVTLAQSLSINVSVVETGTTGSGVLQVNVSNGSTVTLTASPSTGIYNTTATPSTLGCGANELCTITITALDQVANTNSTTTLTFRVDNRTPSVSPDGNPTGSNNSGNFAISGDLADLSVTGQTGSGGVAVNLTLVNNSGAGIQVLSATVNSTRFNFTILTSAFGDGTYNLSINATDITGNQNNTVEATNVRFDTVAPQVLNLSLDEVAAGSSDFNVTPTTNIFINVSVLDNNGSSVFQVNVSNATVLTMTASPTTSMYNITTTPNALGCAANNVCTIVLRAFDNAGNSNTTITLTFRVDNTTPNVTINNPVTGQNSSGNINIAGNLSEGSTGSGVNTTNVRVLVVNNSGAGVQELTATANITEYNFTMLTSAFGDGTYNITVNASDVAGNINDTRTVTNVRIDTTGPQVNNLSLFESQGAANDRNVTPTTSIILNVSVLDSNGSSVFQVNASNGTVLSLTASPSTGIYNLTTTPNALGCAANDVCTAVLRAFDVVGNSNTTITLTFRVDNSSPVVENLTLDEAAAGASDLNVTYTQSVSINVSVADGAAGSGVFQVNVSNGSILTFTASPSAGIFNTTTTPSALGCANNSLCRITVNAIDQVSNLNGSVALVFTVDTMAPNATIDTPANGANSSTNVALQGNYSDVLPTTSPGSGGVTINLTIVNNSGAGIQVLSPTLGTGVSGSWNFSLLTARFGDGSYNITVNASDILGNVNDTVTRTFRIDTTRPQVVNSSLREDGVAGASDFNVTPTTSIRINVTVVDFNGTNTADVNVTNTTVLRMTGSGNGIFNLTTTPNALGCPADDICTVQFLAYDILGNVNSTITLSFRVDNLSPQVTNLSFFKAAGLNDRNVTPGATIQFNVSLLDNLNGSGTLQVNISNGSTQTLTASPTSSIFNITTNASNLGCANNALCMVTITALDQVANTNSSVTLTFRVDNTAPNVTINIPLSSGNVTNGTRLGGNLSDPNSVASNISNVTLMFTNTSGSNTLFQATFSQSEWNLTFLSMIVDGRYNLTLNATDNAGNSNATVIRTNVMVDKRGPITTMVTLSEKSTETFTVSWNATDEAPGNSGVVSFNVQYYDNATGSWTQWQTAVTSTSATFTGTVNHTYFFQANSTDGAGNMGGMSANTSTIVDTEIPSITFNTADYGHFRTDPGAIVDVDFTDNTGLSLVEYRIGATGAWTTIASSIGNTTFRTNWTVNFNGLSEGTNYVYVRATDNQTNRHEPAQFIRFTKDTIAPTSTLGSLDSSQPGTLFTVTWSATDTVSNISNHSVQVFNSSVGNWTPWQTQVAYTSAQYRGAQGVTYYFRANSSDGAGNSGAYSANVSTLVSQDTAGPVATMGSLASTQSSATFTVSWSATDASNVSNHTVHQLNSSVGNWTVWQNGVVYTSAQFVGSSGVTYYFRVNSTDGVGNIGSISANVSTLVSDTTAPGIIGSAPGSSQELSSAAVSLNITTDEAAACRYSTSAFAFSSGTLMTANGTSTVHNATVALDEGTKTYYFKCNDTSGNLMGTPFTLSFTVDRSGTYNASWRLYPTWAQADLPPAAVMRNMTYTNMTLPYMFNPSIGGNFTTVYHYNGTDYMVFDTTLGFAGSTLQFVNNTNNNPYWIKLTNVSSTKGIRLSI